MADSDRDDGEEGEETPTEERAQELEAVAARLFDLLGEQEWRRLNGLLRIARIAGVGSAIALAAAVLVCLQLAVGGVEVLLRYLSPTGRPPGWTSGRF